ncbi:hypothetical protein A3747_14425 [Sulfitobacter sp. HI0076]|nr:hypothetical protein A3747_14425 [Sulfitobacter sp. HI0076]
MFSIAEKELENLQRSIEMLGKSKEEVAALTVKHKLLDEAKKRGLDITDELLQKIDAEAANVGKLAGEYENARDKMAQMEKIQGEWKDSIIDAAMGGADAMDAFTNSLKRAALEYLLFGEGMFAGKGGGGGLLGGIISAFSGARANGGPVRSGGAYLVNENTPNSEVFVPSQSGGILNVPQAQAALRGSGGAGGTIKLIIEEGDMFASRVRTEATGVAVEVTRRGIQQDHRSQADNKYLKGGR